MQAPTLCYRCGEAQDSKTKLFQHIALQHPSSQRRNTADTRTKANRAPMDVRPYCRLCERTFDTARGLEMHTKTSKEHKEKEKWDQAPSFINHTRPMQSPVPYRRGPTLEVAKGDSSQASIDGVSRIGLGVSKCGGGDPPQNVSADTIKFKYGSNYWTIFATAQRPAALQALLEYCKREEHLEGSPYRTRPYDANNLSDLRICLNCDKQRQYIIKTGTQNECIHHAQKPWFLRPKKPIYSCCGRTTSPGCKRLDTHNYSDPDPWIEEKWKLYTQCPKKGRNARKAVALDCEMAGVDGGSELVLLSVVDYLTGEVLINSFVRPTRRIIDWRTRWSGVTPRAMARAVSKGEALDGWQAARAELFKYIDAETVVIGHALHHDLDELKVLHTRVIDSAILAQHILGTSRQWGLKSLCTSVLGLHIQSGGRRGHDCLEDALATREFTLWCISNPQAIHQWRQTETDKIEAKKREAEELRRQEEREMEELRQEKERQRLEEEEREKEEQRKNQEEGWIVQKRKRGPRRYKSPGGAPALWKDSRAMN